MNERWSYEAGWHRGWAAGFATASVVALVAIFVLLAFDSFGKSNPQPVKNEPPKRATGK